ncbi:E3 ubiquitin/ISG15 ligase TRIM25-like [Hyperolius riggenbachi]|uniref:E3 ubiquitin/ISG15 ligase TRIM25-like n=1 Tax=Hyperolius riggenbachi TaxID=752182 RepID=UPI0035A27747
MASAGLREELECSICLSIYTDPVTLRCGHNFCRGCIHRFLVTQEGSGGYSCPECRKKFQERPAMQRNINLCNIVENFLSTQPGQEESQVICSQCFHVPVPAVKSCLMCEVYLCEHHLRVHKMSPEHVFCDPTPSLKDRKCSIHQEVLKYYCTEDAACVCVSCYVIGGHVGHKIVSLAEASECRKSELRNVLQEVMSQREEIEKRVQSLEECRRKAQENADDETERVTDLFNDLLRQLENLEKKVTSDIIKHAQRVSLYCDDIIMELEIKKDELSRKMRHIAKLYNMADPLTVLQASHTGDMCDTEEGDNEDSDSDTGDREVRDEDRDRQEGHLDVAGISHTLHTGLADIMSGVTGGVYIQPADISLEVNTTGEHLQISYDRKSAFSVDSTQNRPDTAERFQNWPQVLSSQSFSSGQHYWEVDIGGSEQCAVGMCYPSIDRMGDQQLIGENSKSWVLKRDDDDQYLVMHNTEEIQLSDKIPRKRVRVYLDYEAGQISFYVLCDPLRHLHTFTATFSEPLHAAFRVWEGRIKISGERPEM